MKKLLVILFSVLSLTSFAQIPSTNIAPGVYLMTYHNNGTFFSGCKIKTKLPFTNGAHMPTIKIEGFDNENGLVIGTQLAFGVADGEFYNATAAASGGFSPPIILTVENGFVTIVMNDGWGSGIRLKITVFSQGLQEASNPSWFQNWQVADEYFDYSTAWQQVSFYNSFPGYVSMNHVAASTGSISTATVGTLTVNNKTTTNKLDVIGGSIFSNFAGWRPYGMYTAKHNNHFTQNAYYDNFTWRSYDGGGDYENAALIQTASADGNAFVVNVAKNITAANQPLTFSKLFSITNAGVVGIGTTTSLVSGDPYKLYVEGGIRTRKIKVDQANWPDYVFSSNYNLRSLSSVENFIKINKHLPDVPSAKDVEKNGVDVGATQAALLRKIEELTLYLIEQGKEIKKLRSEITQLKVSNK